MNALDIISLFIGKHRDECSSFVTYMHTVTVYHPMKTQESEKTMD